MALAVLVRTTVGRPEVSKWWRHCPHVNIRGIYGDEINHTPKNRRLECADCGQLLDGPVSLATAGKEHHEHRG